MRIESFLANSRPVNRRSFFKHVGAGIHGAALLHLFRQNLLADEKRAVPGLSPHPSHVPARAKSVIHLLMNGGRGTGVPHPPRLRRARRSTGIASERGGELASRLPAPTLSGNAFPLHRFAGAQSAARSR